MHQINQIAAALKYADLYLQLQRHSLNHNIHQCVLSSNKNLQKKQHKTNEKRGQSQFEQFYYFNYHQQRVHSKYSELYERLQRIINQTKAQFVIAQANQLRAINNVLKCYIQNMGVFNNQQQQQDSKKKNSTKSINNPNNQSTTEQLQQHKFWVLEKLILDPYRQLKQQDQIEKIRQIQTFLNKAKQSLPINNKLQKQEHQQQFQHSIEEKNDNNKLGLNKVMNIIDHTLLHLEPEFTDNFQSKIMGIHQTLQQALYQLDDYLSRFQDISTNRCLKQTVSFKQFQLLKQIKQCENQLQKNNHHKNIQYDWCDLDYKGGDIHLRNVNKFSHQHSLVQGFGSLLYRNQDHNPIKQQGQNYIEHYPSHQLHQPKQQKPQAQPNIGRMFNKKRKANMNLSSGNKNSHNTNQSIIINDPNRVKLHIYDRWYFDIEGQETQIDLKQYNQTNDYWCRYYQLDQKQQQKLHEGHYDSQGSLLNSNNYNNRRGIMIGSDRLSYDVNTNLFSIKSSSQSSFTTASTAHQSIQSLLQRVYPSRQGDIQSLHYYDQYGHNQMFSLIHPLSNMLQRRLIYESGAEIRTNNMIHQYKVKIQLLQQQVNKMMMMEKKQTNQGVFNKNDVNNLTVHTNKHLAHRNHQNQQRQITQKPSQNNKQSKNGNKSNIYGTVDSQFNQTIKQHYPKQQHQSHQKYEQSKVETTKDIVSEVKERIKISENNQVGEITRQKQQKEAEKLLTQKQTEGLNINQRQNTKIKEQPAVAISPYQNQPQLPSTAISRSIQIIPHPVYDNSPTTLSLIIDSYFSTISIKYTKLAKQEKPFKTFYTPTLQQVHWPYIRQQVAQTVQRIFIVTERPQVQLIRMEKYYTQQKQLVKIIVYGFVAEKQEQQKHNRNETYTQTQSVQIKKRQLLKQKVKQQLYQNDNNVLVTLTYKKMQIPIQLQQASQSSIETCCLLGVLIVLIYEQKVEVQQGSGPYTIKDFYQKGSQLIEEFLSYTNEQKDNSQLQAYTDAKLLFKRIYSNGHNHKTISRINYFFDLNQQEEGVVFRKLEEVKRMMDHQQGEVEVFCVGDGDEDEDGDFIEERPYQQQQKQQQRSFEGKQEKTFTTKQRQFQNQQVKTTIIYKSLQKQQNKLSSSQLIDIEFKENPSLIEMPLKRSNSRKELMGIGNELNQQQSVLFYKFQRNQYAYVGKQQLNDDIGDGNIRYGDDKRQQKQLNNHDDQQQQNVGYYNQEEQDYDALQ